MLEKAHRQGGLGIYCPPLVVVGDQDIFTRHVCQIGTA